jgi:hypothetical protein
MKIDSATKMIARILALTLVVMATASGASWRCLDGTLCQANCGMGSVHGTANPVTVQLGSECGYCPEASVLSAAGPSSAGISHPSGCILSAEERPLLSVQEQTLPTLEFASVIPAGVEFNRPARAESTTASPIPLNRDHFERPYIGRAPPFAS